MQPKLIERFAAPVPRYTSYPTAPHFNERVDAGVYRNWLAQVPRGERLSLYVHIPYCHSLCFYCGCNTKATRSHKPVDGYLPSLLAEVAMVAEALGERRAVGDVHWGGGSPNILSPDEIIRLADALKAHFTFDAETRFAVEIDPRHLTREQVSAFRRAGVTRVSLGVQDVDEAVQAAINRQQPFELTERAVAMCRDAGIASLNVDLIYGLPHQTRASLTRTVERVLSLSPDRLAVFGYAHLPSRFKHQRLIETASLPGAQERYGQSSRIARLLSQAGYRRVGLDHYAKPTDALARDGVRRNFQGYTTDGAETLLAFGASAIGRLPQGYVQNAVAAAQYSSRIAAGSLATVRGRELTQEDRVRAHVIERLMCGFSFDGDDVSSRFGPAAAPVVEEAAMLVEADTDGLLIASPHGFRLRPGAEAFVRSFCAVFDAYLDQSGARHSIGV
jgi:oxygen-independent coproporphyrinogen-3 oxidase